MIINNLAYNLSLIVTFSIISVFLNSRFDRVLRTGRILQGILFGIIVCIGMYHPFVFKDGILVDGRSIIISISTLFFGPLTGLIASLISILFRITLGGAGLVTGILLILFSFLIGYYFHVRKLNSKFRLTWINLYLFGLLTHLVLFLFVFAMLGMYILRSNIFITLSVVGIYPLVTLLIGKILTIDEDNKKFLSQLKDRESLFRTTLYSIGDAVITSDIAGRVLYMNPVAEKLTGWKEAEAVKNSLNEVFKIVNENTLEKCEIPTGKVPADRFAWLSSNSYILLSIEDNKIPIDIKASPVVNLIGEVIGMVLVFRDQTEERARLQSLRESEERLRIALESTNVTIWDWDLEHEKWYLSPTFYTMLGYEPETGKQDRALWKERIHPDDRHRLIGKLDNIRHLNEGNINLVFRIKNRNGTYRWLNIIGESIEKNKDGKITRMTGVQIDVTQSKNTEEELKENEAKYKAFFENSLDAILLTSPDGTVYAANPSACSMFGYTEDELRKLGRLGLVDLKDARLHSLLSERDKHDKIKGELTFINKDGIHIETELTSAVFMDVKGEKKTSMIIRDVTENRKIHEEILRLNNHLNRLIDAVKDLSAARNIADIQSVIKNSSRNLVNSDGVTLVLREGDLCYYSDSDAIEPLWKEERFPIENCINGWSMMTDKQVVIEDIYSDPRINIEFYKSTFVKSLAIVPIRIGSPIGAIGNYWAKNHIPSASEMQLIQTLADASAIALENVQLYNELEIRVNERTAQLLESNKELEAFTYTISHDLRAPLRGISAFTKILMEEFGGSLDKEALRYCTVIWENTKKLGILVDDLLAFSRLGRTAIKKTNVDMMKIVTSVCNDIISQDMRKRIDLKIDNIFLAYCDESLIRQVWINLISNAIKFSSKKKKAHIVISSHEEEDTHVYTIKDNGVGFDQKYVSKLFGVFQRLHKEADFEGIGVGLAIVQRIVFRHNGEVRAEGILGKGATFSFTLPVSDTDKHS